MKTITRGLLAFAVAACLEVPAYSQTLDREYNLEIERQPLSAALTEFSKQTGLQIGYFPETLTDNIYIGPISGRYTAEAAIAQLLLPSGLSFERLNERTIAVTGPEASKTQRRGFSTLERKAADGSTLSFVRLANVRLAEGLMAENEAQHARTTANSREVDDNRRKRLAGALEEVIVTANRRAQRAQDVSSTLQVFIGSDLERTGAVGFADYLNTVPGLGLRTQGNGTTKITIRGISNIGGFDSGWGTTTTTGIYLNDISVQGADVPPDLVLYDLDRIEVLKGPQGTLYGEGAMGGAIKMILNAPNLSEFEGKTDLSVSSTKSGDVNYGVRGAANMPLIEDRLSLRLSGTYLDQEGFVDNVARGEKNHDDKRAYSIRGILAAKITSTLSAEILALNNVLKMEDYPQVDGLSGYQIASAEDRYNDMDSTLVALTLKNDFGFAELTSVTSNLQLERDFVEPVEFGRFFFDSFGPITQDPYQTPFDLKSFSQEFRLVSQGDNRLDWVVGAYFRDKEQDAHNTGTIAASDLAAVNAGLAAASLPLLDADGRYFESAVVQGYEQYALYGEGNLDLGHGFEFTAGLRWYDEEVNTTVTATGYSLVAACCTTPPNRLPTIREKGVIPKFALSYNASDDNLLYAQAAKGFRPGAHNANIAFGGDEGADSDSLWSYEIGSKNSFAEGRAIFNASAFYLNWKGMQSLARVNSPRLMDTIDVIENAGDAEVYGVEAELAASATESFTFGAAFGYTHSELTNSLAPIFLIGSKLPGTPKWTASGYGEYSVPLSLGEAFIRLDIRYAGEQNAKLVQVDALGNITNNGTPLAAYTIGDVKLGLNRDNGWSVSFFIDNLWNERAELSSGMDAGLAISRPQRLSIERPRTCGLLVSKLF